jgi:hypothetical protein
MFSVPFQSILHVGYNHLYNPCSLLREIETAPHLTHQRHEDFADESVHFGNGEV